MARGGAAPELCTAIGSVRLPNPVMTASGTVGHGAELARYLDFSSLGAVVVKSLAVYEWPGNPPPRVHPVPAGMINSVGLQGPGLPRWLAEDLPVLAESGARVVVSVWGRTLDDYAAAAVALAAAESPAMEAVVAVEVNVSCPNLEDRGSMFSHSAAMTEAAMAATASCGLPRWAKLSATGDLAEIARAAVRGGAEALTLINTLPGMVIDTEARKPLLGGGGGGVSGRAMGPVAVRSVFDVYAALPEVPIVGVGGIASGGDAVAMMMAGACAVQVGTATFADPRASAKVLAQLARWCASRGVDRVAELVGAAHG
ncbi:MAG: dihydroorotate dehydrogenase [bacterium]|nr:dihydroorotate dehydrogenase [bacterium]MCY4195227.1 dihydroorotate dehydrogenase [bacterium]MCY4271905.1 dihydroorotate dehydrogenase [bacterium]